MALSDKQRKMIEFIADYVHRHPYPPSVREILGGGGISSTSVVASNLNALERQGRNHLIEQVDRKLRKMMSWIDAKEV